MHILQAWIYSSTDPSSWVSRVARDLETIETELSLLGKERRAIVHVGFHRLEKDEITKFADGCASNIFLTAPAYYALRQSLGFDCFEIGMVQGLPFFGDAEQDGFAFSSEKTDALIHETQGSINKVDLSRFIISDFSWFSALKEQHEKEYAVLRDEEIDSDADYFLLEKHMKTADRLLVGKFRLQHCYSRICKYSPLDLLSICPPWLLLRDFETINFSVRVSNVFRRQNISSFDELAKYTNDQLLKLPGFGRLSLGSICDTIMSLVDEGPFGDEGHILTVLNKPLYTHLMDTLGNLPSRSSDILSRRMGLKTTAQTLEEIGMVYEVTRERIRQIESKTLEKIISNQYWDDVLLDRITQKMHGQLGPLYLHQVIDSDPWFAGFFDKPKAFLYLLENFCDNHISVLRLDGLDIISSMNQNEFEDTRGVASTIVAKAVDDHWTVERLHHEIEALFPVAEVWLSRLVTKQFLSRLHVAKNNAGIEEIISDSRGAEGAVLRVLTEADGPLHYSEVHQILLSGGQVYDLRRVHNALGSVGLMFGRGTFGLEKHLGISQIEKQEVCDAILDLVYSEEPKQWHASEIFDLLSEDIECLKEFNPYKVNVVLQTSDVDLNYLGYSVWGRSDSKSTSVADRVDVRQAIISVVNENGGPMAASKIIERVREARGTSKFIQIHPLEPLVRVGRAMWGLIERDIPASPEQRKVLLAELVEHLKKTDRGVSLSELKQDSEWSLRLDRDGIKTDMLYGLCQLDDRFQTAHGELLGLSVWEDVRCLSLKQATRNALDGSSQGLLLDDVRTTVNQLVGYEVQGALVSQRLALIGSFEPIERRWYLEELDAQ